MFVVVRAAMLFVMSLLNPQRAVAQAHPHPYWQHSQRADESGPPFASAHDLALSAFRNVTDNQLRRDHFQFRVRARNDGGRLIPGESATAFRALPIWYQRWWFQLVVSGIVVCILIVMYRLRVRQLSHAYDVRLEQRLAERARIAREQHDTLLQNFQGLLFRMQAVREMLPLQPVEAIPVLDTALLRGEEAIDLARTAVGELSASRPARPDDVAYRKAQDSGLRGILQRCRRLRSGDHD